LTRIRITGQCPQNLPDTAARQPVDKRDKLPDDSAWSSIQQAPREGAFM
jgi:hypothetical protein